MTSSQEMTLLTLDTGANMITNGSVSFLDIESADVDPATGFLKPSPITPTWKDPIKCHLTPAKFIVGVTPESLKDASYIVVIDKNRFDPTRLSGPPTQVVLRASNQEILCTKTVISFQILTLVSKVKIVI